MTDALSFIDEARQSERQRAIRALLMRPMLSASGPDADDYARVRQHASWIRDWFQRYTGWRLDVDSEVARLRKTPVDGSDTMRPARDRKGTPFNRRRYVLLCLALAVLERCDRQTTLRHVAEGIEACFADDPELTAAGLDFDLTKYEHRKDLVAAIRYLLDLRVLVPVQGDEDQYVAKRGDVLYSIQRAGLTRMPGFLRGPSTIGAAGLEECLHGLLDEPGPTHDDAKNRRIRHRLMRRLLDDPFVLFDELDPDERAYLVRQRGFLTDDIREATGLVPEVRREGIAMVDDRCELSDVRMPEDGTEGHVTLLLAQILANQARCQAPRAISIDVLHAHVAAFVETHGKYWRADARQPGAEVFLVQSALERLEALHLVRRTAEGVTPQHPIARYALANEPSDTLPAAKGRVRRGRHAP